MKPLLLGVNIDHIATLRQARGTSYPDPVHAARIAEQAGAEGITLHLREDRRHIQDHDVYALRESITTRMNFEMALTEEMIQIACKVRPEYVCLVPEKREELTTEGGLNCVIQIDALRDAIARLSQHQIQVSLFIDADPKQIDAAVQVGAPIIELHTGCYAEATDATTQQTELERLKSMAHYAHDQGLIVNAGHGLHYENVQPIAAIEVLHELNIGHAIIARAAFDGLETAVRTMHQLMQDARKA
tara:strand:+ start:998 stop:1732 length:735 start_codon:yes stop_codon:yes gene_type:complete